MSSKPKLHTCDRCGDRTSNPAAHTCRPLAGPQLAAGDRVLLGGIIRGQVRAIRTPGQIAVAVPQMLEMCEDAAKYGAREMAVIVLQATDRDQVSLLIRTPTGWHNTDDHPIDVQVLKPD